MLGKLLDACIGLDDDLMTTHFNRSQNLLSMRSINFLPGRLKKVGT
jgi:hypothetical protein